MFEKAYLCSPQGTETINTVTNCGIYKGVSKSFWTGCLEQELQMVNSLPLSAVVSLFCE